jgi:hypothetical protein
MSAGASAGASASASTVRGGRGLPYHGILQLSPIAAFARLNRS